MGIADRISAAATAGEGVPAPLRPAQQERLTYLAEISALLWPPPASIAVGGSDPGWCHFASAWQRPWDSARSRGSEFVLIIGSHPPWMLIPSGRRVAATALRHYSKPRSRLGRAGVRILSLGLATGLGGTILGARVRSEAPPGSDTIEAYLSTVLACEVKVSILLGPPRANRKPVLQLLTTDGETAGFAKIGTNPLTFDLVRAEHATLAQLSQAQLAGITIPQILHYGEWHDLNVLVLSPLPAWLRHRPLPRQRLASAMSEVARLDGLRREPLLGSTYSTQLGMRLAAADDSPERRALRQALETLAARAGGTSLEFGAWHGDWTEWNMASTSRGLLVWDWERFTHGTPLGFDALHHWLHVEVGPRRRDPRAAAIDCHKRAAHLLAPFGIPAPQARITGILYLADLATRYLADRQAQAGGARGAPGTWLIPAIVGEVTRL